MKIAIIGSGISGLTAAYLLHPHHDVQVLEKNQYIGGHTHTVEVKVGNQTYSIDTGFIVFNDWTYPHFINLMNRFGVAYQDTTMSFSVKSELNGLEYNGNNLNTLFSDRKNLVNPFFLRMIMDILRFNRESVQWLEETQGESALTLGEYLSNNHYSRYFIDHYIVPMGAAIWSAGTRQMMSFPAYFFIRFFKNHGLLSVNNRPQWKVICGGSSNYIPALTSDFKDKIRLYANIETVERRSDQVLIHFRDGQVESFDHVIFACHSDEALALLAAPSAQEQEILDAIPYQENEVLLHTDTRIMPRRKLAWASWNYHLTGTTTDDVAVTYYMNLLQGIQSETDFLVTLNYSKAIDPTKILRRFSYSHPIFSNASLKAQARFQEISGVNRTSYCGAYWRNGFHEDGVWSALRVAEQLGIHCAGARL